jgi:hypothetical protein
LLRATVAGDGRLGPIEERIGRRLIRLVDPQSDEGRSLLGSCSVELLGPGDEPLGRVHPDEACRLLRARLEQRLADAPSGPDSRAWREGLRRLKARSDPVDH